MIPIKNNNAKEIDDTQKGEVFLPHLFLSKTDESSVCILLTEKYF